MRAIPFLSFFLMCFITWSMWTYMRSRGPICPNCGSRGMIVERFQLLLGNTTFKCRVCGWKILERSR